MANQPSPQYAKIVAEDKRAVAYRPNFARLTGSVTAAVLLQQILFYADKHGNKPFYKFKSPCAHKKYTAGDSWCEELGFSRTEFDGALKKIGTKVSKGRSKGTLSAWKLPMQSEWVNDDIGFGCALVSAVEHLVTYWTDGSRVTWYQVNIDLLNDLLCAIYDAKVEILLYLDKARNRRYLDKAKNPLYLLTEISQRDPEKEIPPAQSAEVNPPANTPILKPDDFVVVRDSETVVTPSYEAAKREVVNGGTITQAQTLTRVQVEKNKQGELFQAWIEEIGRDTLPAGFSFKPYMQFMYKLVQEGYEPPDLTCAASLFKAWLCSHKVRPPANWKVGAVIEQVRAAIGLCKQGINPDDVTAFVKARYEETDSKGKRFWAGKLVTFDHMAENIANWKAERQPAKPPEMERVNYPDGTYTLRPKS